MAKSAALRDALGAALLIVCGGVFFITFDVAERVAPALTRYEAAQLDDLLLTLGLAIVSIGWFAMRRWQDSVRQLKQLEALSSQMLEAEEQARQRLAEALHDGVSQTLYACQLQLSALAATTGAGESQAHATEAQRLIATAMGRTRDLTVELSPPILHDLGLPEAIAWLLQRLAQRFDVRMQFTASQAWSDVPVAWHSAVFHSIQELAINAGKHAHADIVQVAAERHESRGICIHVRDDGRGFEPHPGRLAGFGLFSIERRMACIGGELSLQSRPDHGTLATLRLSDSQSP